MYEGCPESKLHNLIQTNKTSKLNQKKYISKGKFII